MQIKIKDLTFSYTQKIILNKVSLDLNSGDFLTLIGKNGTGKSTFIKCLLKIEPVFDNTIFYDGIDINKIKRFKNIGYVPQRLEFNYEFPITVEEILSSAYLKSKDAYFTSIINDLNLNQIFNQNVNTLSGGQLQRVFIARSLLNKPKLLVLDEPTVGIDIDSLKTLRRILQELKKQGVTIIMSTHDIEFINNLSDYYLEFLGHGETRLTKEVNLWLS